MNVRPPARKRPYLMGARADAAAATHGRIVEAAIRRFGEQLYDEVSLGDVAQDAGVTVQTILRRFGSKEGLAAAATEVGLAQVREARSQAPVGDLAATLRELSEHYELWGDRSLLFLAQEERVPALRRVTDAGRALHHAWVDRAFAPWLERVGGAARTRLRARLIAATDVYVWKIMRRDLAMSARATALSMQEHVASVVG